MGTKRGNIRPPGESASILTLAPRLSQEGNWGGCALQLHEFSLWRGATGQGEQAASQERKDACSSTKAPGRTSSVGAGLSFSPWKGDPSPSWPPGSSHPPKPAAVSPVFAKNWREEREAQAVDRKGKKRAPALKHLALSSGAQGNLAPRASALPGARSRENAAVARSPLCF